MIGKKLVEEQPITKSEAFLIIEKLDKETMLYEQKAVMENLKKFTYLSSKKAKEMIKELMGANEKIKLIHAVRIADLMPEDDVDMKVIFAKERFTLSKEEIKAILDIVDKYRG